jgi:hypothetical protein
MSVSNILSTDNRTNNWKNITVGNIQCTSITSDGGISADKIKCISDIPIKQTTPIDNQALIYNAGTSQLEFKTLIDNTGITTLNGCSGLIQSFATATDPIDGFQIVSDSGTNTHTFKIGDASPGKRGFISSGTQSFSGAKTFLGDINYGGNVLYGNNIMNASGSEILVTTPKITLSNSDGAYIAKIKNVDRVTFSGNSYIQNNASAPSIQAVSKGAGDDRWAFGVSPHNNANKHMTIGYDTTNDRGNIYSWDQVNGVRNINIGLYGFPCAVYTTGQIYMSENRPAITSPATGNANCHFAAVINADGTINSSTPGISVSRALGGVYLVTFNATTVYGVTASITETGQCGFITVEPHVGNTGNGPNWQVVTRLINGTTLQDRQFSVMALGYVPA